MANERTKKAVISENGNVLAIKCLVAAAMLLVGMYLSEFSRFLVQPVFNRIFYGNMNIFFYHLACSLFIFTFVIIFHAAMKKRLGINLMARKKDDTLPLGRKIALYVMTVIPVLVSGMALNFQFKLVYSLGERVDGMVFLGNAMGYAHVAAKLLCIVYFIALVEKAFEILYPRLSPFPVGGIAALLTFGWLEMIFAPSIFSWLYMFLICYMGVVYTVSRKNYKATFVLGLIMWVL